jgi:hypothetical protein
MRLRCCFGHDWHDVKHSFRRGNELRVYEVGRILWRCSRCGRETVGPHFGDSFPRPCRRYRHLFTDETP